MAAARAMLDEVHELLPKHTDDTNTYVLGSIQLHNVVIACLPDGQYGTNNAAIVATNMLRTFKSISTCLMVGIGGGVPSRADVRLGDVIVGTRVMQSDLGKVVGDGELLQTAIPRIPHQSLGTVVSALRSKHELSRSRVSTILQQHLGGQPRYSRPNVPDRLFHATYDHESITPGCDKCDQSKVVPRNSRTSDEIIIHYGAIASGNQVMRSGTTRDKVAQRLDVVCFEMETAGLLDILPCLPIRGICDYSDSHKNKEWQRYAAATAAAYARELLEEMPVTEACTGHMYVHDLYNSSPEDRRRHLLNSLRFEQIDSRKMNIKAAHSKTCQWFLGHSSYKEWLDPAALTRHHGFLWISGKPGAGKSTIMKFAYERLRRKAQIKHTITASFFFNARGESLEKSIIGMYRSLILQLLEGYSDLQTVLDDPELVSQSSNSCPPLNCLKDIFLNSVSALGQREFTCFVDALDECDEQQVVDMIQFFEDLTEQSSAKGVLFRICFSSRHYPYIIIRQGIRLTLEDQPGHAQDLQTYAANRLRIDDPSLAEELQVQLLSKAAGVFMWVVLVVDILNKEYRRGGMFLTKRLAEIPSDLSDLFKDILRRDNEDMEALLFCILWILYAKRPLQPKEFYHAVWSGLSLNSLVDDRIPDVTIPNATDGLDQFDRYIIHSSKGLAEVTKSKEPTVQFIHESVRDFLIKDNGLFELWPELGLDCERLGHEKLKQCCSRYLNDTLYANKYILYHANIAVESIPQNEFLSSFPLSTWIMVHNASEDFKTRRYTQGASLMYVLADNGYSGLIRIRLKDEPQSYVPQERYKYPLFAALANCRKDAVAALLDLPTYMYEGVDITQGLKSRKDFKRYGDQTPLSWAAQEGRNVILKQLIQNGAYINEQDRGGLTPLSRAVKNGHEAVAKLLVEKGAEVNTSDNNGYTPLLWASQNGHEAVARLLVEKGAEVNTSDNNSYTPLLWASQNGHEAVARLLVEKGAEVDTSDKRKYTPLIWASQNGHEAVARLLLEKGADVNAYDSFKYTPLLRASQNGHETVVKLLVKNGADINTTTDYGYTPLICASRKGDETVVKLLVEKGAEVNVNDSLGYTPLILALQNGHEAVARLLVEKGAEVNTNDSLGYTPLIWALHSGNEAVARLLVEQGADFNISDNNGYTPLLWASQKGYEALARLLVEKGAEANASDTH
ncbi:Pfs, NACHT and Ankyrin domain protein [Aspergillus tubingensis]|uniref:Pfs, NACHT and Ankyrin domain protein n=1 Tax=Aspergillus tubingensis TaxID=5068 RepID=UPI0015779D47|nr:Pfs, NACHT and ankyrin domain protein [Aspergillus tubingensis]GFN21442.1 Pfs, NACHT and ankyrin domain protein [Aspergillus tubingensis]